jgi:hypothetical protein
MRTLGVARIASAGFSWRARASTRLMRARRLHSSLREFPGTCSRAFETNDDGCWERRWEQKAWPDEKHSKTMS